MEISEQLKNFLKDPEIISLINKDEWELIYNKLYRSDIIGEFSEVLVKSGLYTTAFNSMKCIPKKAFYKSKIDHFIIPNEVVEIGDIAFDSCYFLKDIVIPESVEVIGASAFYNCDLLSLRIPDSVKHIEYNAFLKCNSITNLVIGDGVIDIGNNAFKYVFNLVELTIGKNVAQIGSDAFTGCDNLRKANYKGTMENWKNIEIQGNNKRLYRCKIMCTDGILKYDKQNSQWIKA